MAVRNSIAGALPQLITRESMLRARANALGIDYRIADFGGLRTQTDTVLILGYRAADYAAAVANNPSVAALSINEWRPIAPFGSSMHNYGAAFDVLITRTPPGMSEGAALAQLKSIAPSIGLRSSVPNDPPHFELPLTLDEARRAWGDRAPGIATVGNVAAASTVLLFIGVAIVLASLRRSSASNK